MKKFFFLAMLLLAPGIVSGAQHSAGSGQAVADSLWDYANSCYADAAYSEALDVYLQIEQTGTESAALYYNMGNAYFKMHYLAQAIVYYEKALRLDPNNPDVQYNLSVARDQCIDRIEPVPQFFVAAWLHKSHRVLPSGMWSAISFVLLALALGLFLLFLFADRIKVRKTSFVLSILVFLLSVTSGIFAWQSKKEMTREDTAVVVSAVSPVKSAPGAQGKDLLVLHEGTKVRVLEEMGEWARIELEDGRQGWVLLHEIVFVY